MKTWIVAAACYAALYSSCMGEDHKVSDLTVEASIARVSGTASSMDFGFDALWLAQGGKKLIRVNGLDNSVSEIELRGASNRQREIAVGEGAVWVPDVGTGTIFKVDPVQAAVVAQVPAEMVTLQATIGTGEGAIWVVTAQNHEKTLTRFNANSGVEEARVTLPSPGAGVIVAYRHVWVTSPNANALYRIDPAVNAVVGSTALGQSPRYLAAGADSIWVSNMGDGTVQRIDPLTGEVRATISLDLSSNTGDLAFGGGYVWVTVPYRVAIIRIDPADNSVLRYMGRGGFGYIAYGSSSVWVWGQSILRFTPPGN